MNEHVEMLVTLDGWLEMLLHWKIKHSHKIQPLTQSLFENLSNAFGSVKAYSSRH